MSKDWKVEAPRLDAALGELFAGMHIAAGAVNLMFRGDSGAKGDGRPVLLIPGLGTTDIHMAHLSMALRLAGYDPHGWELGLNSGYEMEKEQKLLDRVRELSRKTGKVAVIGWSMGGMYARALGLLAPDHVSRVITLGTPLSGVEDTTPALLYEGTGKSMRDFFEPAVRERLEQLTGPIPVPFASIYSEEDGIAFGPSCFVERCAVAQTQTIKVSGPHFALPSNPEVFNAVERLMEAEPENWLSAAPD